MVFLLLLPVIFFPHLYADGEYGMGAARPCVHGGGARGSASGSLLQALLQVRRGLDDDLLQASDLVGQTRNRCVLIGILGANPVLNAILW